MSDRSTIVVTMLVLASSCSIIYDAIGRARFGWLLTDCSFTPTASGKCSCRLIFMQGSSYNRCLGTRFRVYDKLRWARAVAVLRYRLRTQRRKATQ